MHHSDSSLLHQLSLNSEPYHDPLSRLDWSLLSTEDYWLPESAISLTGILAFEDLPEESKRKLSQYEFIHFIQAGTWLEGILMERIGKTLKEIDSLAEYAYLLHELREEAGHGLMFIKLMEKSGLKIPSNWLNRPSLADLAGRHGSIDSPLFWLARVLGEEIPDKLNRHVRFHGDQKVNPLIKEICMLHIMEEARHIARAHNVLEEKIISATPLSKFLLAMVAKKLIRQFARTFFIPTVKTYELAGLTPGDKWQKLAISNPRRQAFMNECITPTLHLLNKQGLKINLPKL